MARRCMASFAGVRSWPILTFARQCIRKLLLVTIVCVGRLSAQVPASGMTALSGAITDATGAYVPHARIELTSRTSHAVFAADDLGRFTRSVKLGLYAVHATAPGFSVYEPYALQVRNTPAQLAIHLIAQGERTSLTVTAEEAQVSVEPNTDASAPTLRGRNLEALADDPDELASQLSAMAGLNAGSNAGRSMWMALRTVRFR